MVDDQVAVRAGSVGRAALGPALQVDHHVLASPAGHLALGVDAVLYAERVGGLRCGQPDGEVRRTAGDLLEPVRLEARPGRRLVRPALRATQRLVLPLTERVRVLAADPLDRDPVAQHGTGGAAGGP